MTTANRRSRALPLAQIVVLLVLVGLFLLGSASGYLKGQWSWQKAPEVSVLKQLGNLKNRGIELPGWSIIEQNDELGIGGHAWHAMRFKATESSQMPETFNPVVFLRPQLASVDMPQVDWTDMQGHFGWNEDDVRRISWTVDGTNGTSEIEARLVRGWQPGNIYAALEWYAWPGGGSPEPGDWFWRDRSAQWQGQRVPWVAATVLLPMPPGAELDQMQPLAEKMGGQVQQAIEAAIAS